MFNILDIVFRFVVSIHFLSESFLKKHRKIYDEQITSHA
jgi:hypothetical protein